MKLKKFTKNQKQKRIVIGSIVGVILLIGGFTLYKTFALYKEERSFDVLQGNIPDFVYGDVKLAIKLNGVKQGTIPENSQNYVVVTECDNGAEIEWDYDNWGPIIKNVSKETRCSLNFVSNNKLDTLGKLSGIENLNNVDSLIANIDTLTQSKQGMIYLAKSPDLVKQMQESNGKYTDDIKKKILNSTVISEDLKYEAGLPCYLLKDKQVLKAAGDIVLRAAFFSNNSIPDRMNAQFFGNSHSLHVSLKNNAGVLQSQNAFDVKNYTKLELDYQHKTDDSTSALTGTIHFGMHSNQNSVDRLYDDFIKNLESDTPFQNYSPSNYKTSNKIIDIKSKGEQYFWLVLKHNGEVERNSVSIILNSIALY